MGVMTVKNTLNNLSAGNVLAGLTYMKIQGTKKQTTTVMWETTCLEGFLPPFLTQVLQRVQNDSIGDE